MHEVVEALRRRRSSRAIDPRPVEREKIEALVEAFRWSPSTHNKQPWRLLLAESAATRAAWDGALDPVNQLWAPRAPVKLTIVGNPGEQEGWHGQHTYMLDCGLALQSLLVQACAMGLSCRALIGWNEEKVLAAHRIPAPFRAVALVVAGYPGPVSELPEPVQQKEMRQRIRKSREEIFFRDTLG
jgi:nitroreductase